MNEGCLAVLVALLALTAGCVGAVDVGSEGLPSLSDNDETPGDEPLPEPPNEPLTELSAAEDADLPDGVGLDGVDERALFDAHREAYANESFAATYSRKFYRGDESNRHEVHRYETAGSTALYERIGHEGTVQNRSFFRNETRTFTKDVRPDGSVQYGTVAVGPTPDDGLQTEYLAGIVPFLDLRVTDTKTEDGELLIELGAFGVKDDADASGRSRITREEHRKNLSATLWVDSRSRIRSLTFDTVRDANNRYLSRSLVTLTVTDVGGATVEKPEWVDAPRAADGSPIERVEMTASMYEDSYVALTVERGEIPAGSIVLADLGGATVPERLTAGDALYLYGTGWSGRQHGLNATLDQSTLPNTEIARLDREPRNVLVKSYDHRPYWEWNATESSPL